MIAAVCLSTRNCGSLDAGLYEDVASLALPEVVRGRVWRTHLSSTDFDVLGWCSTTSAISFAILAAENIVNADRVQEDHRQNDDASIENETKRSIGCSGVSHSDGIGHHIRPEHHPKRHV